MIFRVDLFQTQSVGGKVLPAEYEVVLTDSCGNEVSDVRVVHADMMTADDSARISSPQFALKAGYEYDSKSPYYLVCRNKATGGFEWSEEFQVSVAFVPMDDFGF